MDACCFWSAFAFLLRLLPFRLFRNHCFNPFALVSVDFPATDGAELEDRLRRRGWVGVDGEDARAGEEEDEGERGGFPARTGSLRSSANIRLRVLSSTSALRFSTAWCFAKKLALAFAILTVSRMVMCFTGSVPLYRGTEFGLWDSGGR